MVTYTLRLRAIVPHGYLVCQVLNFRRILLIIAGFVTCYVIAVDFVCLFQWYALPKCQPCPRDLSLTCTSTPIHSFWDVGVPGHCINIDNFFIGSGSVNVVLDFIIFAMPIPLLWRLRTSFNQKLVLTLVFTVAGFVVIVSIVRLVVLSRIGRTDLTWNYINSGIWTNIEPSIAVICACLPSLRPLVSILSHGWQRIPDLKSKLSSTSNSSRLGVNKKRIARRSGGQGYLRGTRRDESDGMFSRLEEMEGGGAIGHEVRVLGGDKEGDGREGVPERGIQVKTEVVLVSSERVDYLDRLF
ncbi:MAG: hypothetical protein LQ352_004909 [Teloschistes flavicans]|nr:MAG: hypothetical protein LQ352_004909 [Teloschistes flavicans]